MVSVTTEDNSSKKMLSYAILEWLTEHDMEIERWAEKNLNPTSQVQFINELFRPGGNENLQFLAFQIFRKRGRIEPGLLTVSNKLISKKGQIFSIVGAKGGGKTVLAFSIAAICSEKGIPVYYYGIPTTLPPFFVKSTTDWDSIPTNCLVIIDEASILLYNRRHTERQFNLIEQLPVLRHGGRNVIVITQNSATIDVNLVRFCMPLDTEISTPEGYVKLGSLKTNDIVNSYNLKKGIIEEKPILAHPPEKKQLHIIHLENNKKIRCSKDHKFLTEKRGWIAAKDLQKNEKIFKAGGKCQWIGIKKLEKTNKLVPMRDLTVKDNNNFILKNGIVAHNCDGILFKNWTMIQDKTERKIYASELKYFMPQRIDECLFWDNESVLSFRHDLPAWWLRAYSTTFEPFKNRQDAMLALIDILKEQPLDEAMALIKLRNPPISPEAMKAVKRFIDFYDESFVDTHVKEMPHFIPQYVNQFMNEIPINTMRDFEDKFKQYNYSIPYEVKKHWDEIDDCEKKNLNTCINMEIEAEIRNSVIKKNFIAGFVGFMGTGKSYSMLSLADFITRITLKKAYLPTHIYFDGEALLNSLTQTKKGDVVCRDEITSDFGLGTHRVDSEIENALETLRKPQKNFLFASPRLKINPELLKFVFSVYGYDEVKGVAKVLVFRPDMYPRRPDGFITLKKPALGLLNAYEIKKDEFVKKVEERSTNEKNFKELAKGVIAEAAKEGVYLESRKEWVAFARDASKCKNRNSSEIDEIATWCIMLSKEE